MREEEHERNDQDELNRSSLSNEEEAAEDQGLELKSGNELERDKKLVESMDQPDSFEY
ncbi:hypothetical protein J2Z22_000371 [Paenibacillus forsythiae]|uniref:Multidrug transporter n=1 Tax=Paenibacillus forsythiae TaxID=365616 RepID=A0ABU3H214_9BACL|nr:hypothetical protein [Paenibacillus forsythiae]MDT3424859.1 hypothetical protein [Paenibacillus forsythiae]